VRWTGTGEVGGGTRPARVSYDSYGKARHHRGGDLDGDGKVDGSDQGDLMGVWDTVITDSGYRGDADFNRDGEIDGDDLGSLFGFWGAALPAGQISFTTAGGPDNSIGWDGYVFNPATGDYIVRWRTYIPALGNWMNRDPLGYVDGPSLYLYASDSPLQFLDPFGLAAKASPYCCDANTSDALRRALQDLLGLLAEKMADATTLQLSSISVKLSVEVQYKAATFTLRLADGTIISGTWEELLVHERVRLKSHFERVKTFGEFGDGFNKLMSAWSALSYMLDTPQTFCDMFEDLFQVVGPSVGRGERWRFLGDAQAKAIDLANAPGTPNGAKLALGVLKQVLLYGTYLKGDSAPHDPFTDDDAVRQRMALLMDELLRACGCRGGGKMKKLIDSAEWVRSKVPGV